MSIRSVKTTILADRGTIESSVRTGAVGWDNSRFLPELVGFLQPMNSRFLPQLMGTVQMFNNQLLPQFAGVLQTINNRFLP